MISEIAFNNLLIVDSYDSCRWDAAPRRRESKIDKAAATEQFHGMTSSGTLTTLSPLFLPSIKLI
jgi:hypothetical protein